MDFADLEGVGDGSIMGAKNPGIVRGVGDMNLSILGIDAQVFAVGCGAKFISARRKWSSISAWLSSAELAVVVMGSTPCFESLWLSFRQR